MGLQNKQIVGLQSMYANNDAGTLGEQSSSERTVGEHLDMQIANARKRLETACIIKAKAEAMQFLNVPMSFIEKIGYPF